MSGRNSKRRRTSPVWDYFRRQDGKITCSICNKDFADGGGTSNLQKHLRAKHVDEAKKCFGEADAKQPLMSMFTDARRCSPARATRITELIAEMVARDLRPLSVVEGDGFRQLVNYIEPNYRVPSRPHIRSVCQKLYASTKENLLVTLQSHYVAFTSDLWTSQAVQAYLTVTAHFITEQWVLESYVLETKEMPEHHTGRIIGNLAYMHQIKNVT